MIRALQLAPVRRHPILPVRYQWPRTPVGHFGLSPRGRCGAQPASLPRGVDDRDVQLNSSTPFFVPACFTIDLKAACAAEALERRKKQEQMIR